MISKFHTITLTGFTLSPLPKTISTILNKEVSGILSGEIKADKINNKLAGFIEKQHRITKSLDAVTPYIYDLTEEYLKYTGDKPVKRDRYTIINPRDPEAAPELWVNFQEKQDINPIHSHGGLVSFVIWLKIPFLFKDEQEHPSVKNSKTAKMASTFTFYYTDTKVPGGIGMLSLPVDKTWEDNIIMFPSWLNHSVYPFQTSSAPRISIAGNVFLKNV
jgi:hypothetical protein